jgi:histidine triad (HIT) family protein
MLSEHPCVFCDILAGILPSSPVYQDEACLAFLDIQPVNPGHVLVIPKVHAVFLADLPAELGGSLFKAGMQIAAALRASELDCEGVNFQLADGEAAGQEVFHVHLHVIPRFKGDGFGLKFGPGYTQLPPRSELDAIGTQLRQQMP